MRSQSNQNESFFLNQQHFVSIDLWDFITTFEVWRHDQGESVKKFKRQHLLNKWVSRQAQQCLGPWVHKRWLWFQILHTVTLPPVQTQALQDLSHILQNPIGGAEQLQKLIRWLALGRPHPVWTGICGELLPLYVQQYQWLCHLQESPVGACHSSCRCCSWNMKGLPQASCLIEELVPGWGWLCCVIWRKSSIWGRHWNQSFTAGLLITLGYLNADPRWPVTSCSGHPPFSTFPATMAYTSNCEPK